MPRSMRRRFTPRHRMNARNSPPVVATRGRLIASCSLLKSRIEAVKGAMAGVENRQVAVDRGALARTVSVQMLDWSFMSPGDLINGNVEDSGNALPLGRGGCPAAEQNRRH